MIFCMFFFVLKFAYCCSMFTDKKVMHLRAFKCLKNAKKNESMSPRRWKRMRCATIHSLLPESLFYLFVSTHLSFAYPSKPPPAKLGEGGVGASASDGISEICKSNHFPQRQWRHINKPLHWRLTAFFFSLSLSCGALHFILNHGGKNANQVLRSLWLPVFPRPSPSSSLINNCAKRKWRGGKKKKKRDTSLRPTQSSWGNHATSVVNLVNSLALPHTITNMCCQTFNWANILIW